MTEREFATEVVQRLQQAGHVALFAGGCVRDELLGLTPADYDVATSARPEQVQALFRRSIGIGASFGVIEVLGPKDAAGEWLKVQVATFRSDGSYTDGRRPDSVTFSSPEEDAARRDFTINGLFRDPVCDKVFDYVGGQADLKAKVLRAIGNPEERFTEDKLRILRAVRMAARFELTVDAATLVAAQRMAPLIKVVSPERIADELRKILKHPTRGHGVRLLAEFGLLEPLLPEVNRDAGEWERTCQAISAFPPEASFEVAFSALLRGVPPKAITALCKRLRLSNDELDRVVWLCTHRTALAAANHQPNSRLFPLLSQAGVGELVKLHRAEGTDPHAVAFAAGLLRDNPPETFQPTPLLTGDDLKVMGLKPGPQFKKWLDQLRAAQLDGELKTRKQAEEKIWEWVRADSGV
jgi:tRNA nucleotidyltransferase/poly(A) polymerase